MRLTRLVHTTRAWISISIVLAITTAVGFALYAAKPTYKEERVPGFPLLKFDGAMWNLEEFRGKPVVLNFWAAWCIFCRKEMPDLERVHRAYKDRGVIVLGIHRSETEEKSVGEEFARSVGTTYPLVIDINDRMFNYFGKGAPTVPITVFINRDGYVEERVVGPRTEDQFRLLVEKIL